VVAILEADNVLSTGDPVHAGLDRLLWPVETVARVPLVQTGARNPDVMRETGSILTVDRRGKRRKAWII
jgi:hypothetical protein